MLAFNIIILIGTTLTSIGMAVFGLMVGEWLRNDGVYDEEKRRWTFHIAV